jgi:hypothetical protein
MAGLIEVSQRQNTVPLGIRRPPDGPRNLVLVPCILSAETDTTLCGLLYGSKDAEGVPASSAAFGDASQSRN